MSSAQRLGVPFPSGRPVRDKVERALEFLRSNTELAPFCPLLEQAERWTSEPGYLCGSDQQRAEELMAMWSESGPARSWCGRGGYGATRLLGLLQSSLEGTSLPPSRLLGYSDITALFALIKVLKLPIDCVHAPVLTELPDHPEPETVFRALEGIPCSLPVGAPDGQTASFSGTIWGGNLAVLASLCGTPWLPRLTSGAAFLEDVDESPYRLDRFVTQLHDSGFFARCDGVFLGQFTRCGSDNAGHLIVRERLRDLGIALLGDLPVGHEAYHLPLFLDLPYRFDAKGGVLQPLGDRSDALNVRNAAHHVAIDGG